MLLVVAAVAAIAATMLTRPEPAYLQELDGAMAVDCNADQLFMQSNCTYPDGATFRIDIHVTEAPANGYNAFQVKVRWNGGILDGVLDYLIASSTSAEALWSRCDLRGRTDNRTLGDPSVVFGCQPLVTDLFFDVGAVLRFEFVCQTTGISPLVLVPRAGDVQEGTHFTDQFFSPFDPALTNASVTCGNPPTPTPSDTPTPTITPTPTDTPTPTLSPTPTLTLTPTQSPTPTITPTPTPLPSERPDVTIVKSDSPDPVESNGVITYTLEVRSIGVLPTTDVEVVDTLPSGTAFVSASAGCTYDGVEHEVTCAVGDLAADDSSPGGPDEATLQIQITAPKPVEDDRILNVAVVSASNEDFLFTGNNRDFEETVVLAPRADVILEKTDDEDPVPSGGSIIYRLRITNIGPVEAEKVVVQDTLPEEITFVAAQGAECVLADGVVTCDIGNLPPQGQATVEIEVIAPVITQDLLLKNSAFVSANNELFSQTGNNLDIENTAVVAADPNLAISKSDSQDPVWRTRYYSYTLTVTNLGGGDAKDVSVTDVLPSTIISTGTLQPVTFVDAKGADCQEVPIPTAQTLGVDPAQNIIVQCVIPFVAANGGEVVITLNVRAPTVLEDTLLTNEVSATDPDEPSDPPDNNSASEPTLMEACFDVTGNATVTVADIGTIVAVFGLESSDPEYDLLFDFNGNGTITIADVGFVVSHFGQACSEKEL